MNDLAIPSELQGFEVSPMAPIVAAISEELNVENNDYAAKGYEHKQVVCTRKKWDDSSVPLVGFVFDYPEPNGNVMAYPEIIYGKKPWAPDSTTQNLPIQIKEIKELTVDLQYRRWYDANSKLNAALDMFIVNHPNAKEENIVAEVMIWVENAGNACPAGTKTHNGYSSALYVVKQGEFGWTKPWDYFAFEYTANVTKCQIDILAHLQTLAYSDLIHPLSYLASIEFGNEIWKGSGYTIVDRFDVGFQRHPIQE